MRTPVVRSPPCWPFPASPTLSSPPVCARPRLRNCSAGELFWIPVDKKYTKENLNYFLQRF